MDYAYSKRISIDNLLPASRSRVPSRLSLLPESLAAPLALQLYHYRTPRCRNLHSLVSGETGGEPDGGEPIILTGIPSRGRRARGPSGDSVGEGPARSRGLCLGQT